MNPEQAGVILMEIVAVWPNPAMPTIVMEAWAEVIEPLDFHQAHNAVKELAKTHTYRPVPIELEDACRPVAALHILKFKPPEIEGVLPKETQLERLRAVRASLRHIDDLDDEKPGKPA